MTPSALSGVKVLDLTHLIAGPYCTRILAGFGADVLKIERPGEGDGARRVGPFLDDVPGPERSALFLYLNSNKRGVTLDLKSPRGAEIFKEMVEDADVVVENFSPGVMKRLGLDYASLKEINPRLVMTSVSNFGQTGPYAQHGSSHLTAWGMSGARYTNGRAGERPVQLGGWITHYVAGIYGTIGTATALLQRTTTGAGQHVDVSMMDSAIMLACHPSSIYSFTGRVHTDHSGRSGREVLETRDGGFVSASAWTYPQWERLFALLGAPEVTDDPEFKASFEIGNEKARRSNRGLIRTTIAEKVKDRDRMELFDKAMEWMVPLVLVATTQEVLDSPQLRAREFFEEVDHPVIGKAELPGAPFKMSETPWIGSNAAPTLGQHNSEVYTKRLGLADTEISLLSRQGVI